MALLPVQDATRLILKGVSAKCAEDIPLADSLGRIAAQGLAARRTQPPFSASAMDGYAVRHEDVVHGMTLRCVGEIPAGQSYDNPIYTGETVRIFNGAPLPEGADTILIQENAELVARDEIKATETPKKGAFVRPAGLDFQTGDTLIPAETPLRAAHIALLASMDYPRVTVRQKPRIGILATGDELVMPGETPKPQQIIASNNFGVSARVTELGGTPIALGIAADKPDALEQALSTATDKKCDVIVTLGGASVGAHDLVRGVFSACGFSIDFWKIAMRPGKPLMFGKRDTTRFLGLPGNPVSSMVCTELFLRPLINAYLGQSIALPFQKAVLTTPLPANDQREEYLRATISAAETNHDARTNAAPKVTPAKRQDSSMLAIFTAATALIRRPAFADPANVGDVVDILKLNDT